MIQAALLACWPPAAGLALVCGGLAILARRVQPQQRRRLRALFGDERGSVQSLSFVLTVPVFIMLMMLAVQITQLMIGEIIVHYAAFAAARAAAVWVPARFEQTPELANWLNMRAISPMDTAGGAASLSPKAALIHRAAALACLSISPSRDLGLADLSDSTTQALVSTFSAYSTSAQANRRIPMRLANKWAYASRSTRVDVSTFHRQFGTSQSAYQNEPPLWNSDPYGHEGYYQPTEIGWRDEITVKVTHNFALLPGPGRLLARQTTGTQGSSAANRIQQAAGVYSVPLSASATMVPEGEKSIVPYLYQGL